MFTLSKNAATRLARVTRLVENPTPALVAAPSEHFPAQYKIAQATTALSSTDTSSKTFSWFKSTAVGTTEVQQGSLSAYFWAGADIQEGDKCFLFRPIPSPRWYAFSPSSIDEKVKVTSADTDAGYLSTQIVDPSTDVYDSNQDATIDQDVESPGSSEMLRLFFNASQVTGYSTNARQFLGHESTPSNLKWLDDPGASTACTVKVSADDTTCDYLDNKIVKISTGDLYESNEDLTIDSDVESPGGAEQIRWYINSDTITGYSSDATQYLGRSSGGFTWLAGTVATDILVKVSVDDTAANYLLNQFNSPTTAYDAVKDVRVHLEELNPGADETLEVFLKADGGDISSYVSSERQSLFHMSTGDADPSAWYWYGFANEASFVTAQDLDIKHEITEDSTNAWRLHTFIHASTITGYNQGAEQFLGHNAAGVWRWLPGSAGGDDKFVAVTTGDTPDYLENQVYPQPTTATYLSTQDFTISIEKGTTAGDSKLRWFIDASNIGAFDVTASQRIGHSSGSWKWFDDNDIAVQATAGAPAGPLDVVTQLYDITTYASDEDLNIYWVTDSNKARAFVPADGGQIINYSKFTEQHLGHDASGNWSWLAPGAASTATTFTDQYVRVGSGGTAQFLDASFKNYASVLYESDEDLNIYFVTDGVAPGQQVRAFIPSDGGQIINYSKFTEQHLGHDASGNWAWIAPPSPSTGGDFDEKVKLNAGTTAAYLNQLFQLYGTETYAGTSEDIDIYFVTDGVKARAFIPAQGGQATGYNPSVEQHLGHAAGGTIGWFSPSTGGGSGDDKFVAVVAGDTPAYLADQLEDHTAVAYTTAQDIVINSRTEGITADKKVRWFVDGSAISGFDASNRTQLLGLSQFASRPKWFYFHDEAINGTYVTPNDQPIKVEDDGSAGGLRAFIDASSISLHSTGVEQVLGHYAAGTWRWYDISSVTVVTDVRVNTTNNTLEKQTKSMWVINPSSPSAWTVWHTGDQCT